MRREVLVRTILCTALLLVIPSSRALGQPVIFSLETNNGNDSVYVGTPSNIRFMVNANGAQIQGLVYAALLIYTGGNWLGPMSDVGLSNVVPSALANSTFASKAWNPGFGQGTNPDTILYGFTSFGGPWTANAEVWRVNFTPSGPGTLIVDPINAPDPPLPCCEWSALDPGASVLPIQNDLPVIHSTAVPPEPPQCDGAIVELCPGPPNAAFTGGVLMAHATSTVPSQDLLDFRFKGFRKNGSPATPQSPPSIRTFGGVPLSEASELLVIWEPAAGEAGTWELCFESITADDTLECCAEITVLNPSPNHVQWRSRVIDFSEINTFDATLELEITTSPDSTNAIVLPFLLHTVAGSAYFAGRPDSTDFIYPPAFNTFDFKPVNNFPFNMFGNPDSLLLGLVDLFAVAPGIPAGNYTVGWNAQILPQEGIIQIDTSTLPPSNWINFISTDGQTITEIIPSYEAGCFPVLSSRNPVCFEFDCVEDVLTGSTVCVPLTIDNVEPCLELGGFDLLFTYDASLLTFQGLDMVGSVLDAADWEYLTYRIVSTNPALIRIVAIADMNNSNHHPNTLCLDGLIANVCFKVTHDQNAGCQSAHIQFYWDDCGDNTASDPTGDVLYILTDPNGDVPYPGGDPANGINGGGIISNSCGIEGQLATMDGGINGPEQFPCPNPDTTKPDPKQGLCFVNGKIKIICPGDIDDRGDINLNGLAYEIADAVLYSNYFIQGPQVFAINPAGQIAASDVNADGTPLTVADLVYLIRVITGDALPIAGDLLSGGPKVSAGTLMVTSAQQGANVTVSANSDADLGAGLFVFNYSGSDIAGVSAVGRASNMNVLWDAADGKLRVLMLPPLSGSREEERSLVAAGSGPILSINTHGAMVDLVSMEAASFMGGALEANVTARVVPTQFALQQNYPNPFNPSTSMSIDFPTASDYELTIYNVAGQTVRTFAGYTEAGTVKINWDGRDAGGSRVATGVYFYSVEAGAFKDVKKMMLLK